MSLSLINLVQSSILSSAYQRLKEETMYYFCKESNNLGCIFANVLGPAGDLPKEVLGIQEFSQHLWTV